MIYVELKNLFFYKRQREECQWRFKNIEVLVCIISIFKNAKILRMENLALSRKLPPLMCYATGL